MHATTSPTPNHKPSDAKASWWTNVLAVFLRHRHVRASGNEWIHVHRGHQHGSPHGSGNGWLAVLAVLFVAWAAYHIFCWIVDVARVAIQAIASFLCATLPFLLIGAVLAAIVYWSIRHRR